VKPSILVQHEPKRAAGKGAPDFKVSDGGLILGYVENKTIGDTRSKITSRPRARIKLIRLPASAHFALARLRTQRHG
jgi:hypothetical protein